MQSIHDEAVRKIRVDPTSWTSHTVVVVDQSGSMRKTDVGCGVTRSDAVWLSLAIDFVAHNLADRTATATDVVSVVAMNQISTLLIDRQPHDWLLFNAVVGLLRSQEPFFDGNYVPALEMAEELLLQNAGGQCALALFFLSDGRPSDIGRRDVLDFTVECIASRFGRRLSVVFVGFAGDDDEFCILADMASRAEIYGTRSSFLVRISVRVKF